jgi:hypothetical protein
MCSVDPSTAAWDVVERWPEMAPWTGAKWTGGSAEVPVQPLTFCEFYILCVSCDVAAAELAQRRALVALCRVHHVGIYCSVAGKCRCLASCGCR